MGKACHWTTPSHLGRGCRFGFLGISLIIIVLDQLTKHIVRGCFSEYEVKPVMEYWNWVLAYNQGAAFSFLANQGGWQKLFFGIIAFLVAIGLVYYLLNRAMSILTGLALSFILGGAIGNLVDRILFGRVTDFIDWHYKTHHWPAFNVADSFITVGVAILIIESIFFARGKDTGK